MVDDKCSGHNGPNLFRLDWWIQDVPCGLCQQNLNAWSVHLLKNPNRHINLIVLNCCLFFLELRCLKNLKYLNLYRTQINHMELKSILTSNLRYNCLLKNDLNWKGHFKTFFFFDQFSKNGLNLCFRFVDIKRYELLIF